MTSYEQIYKDADYTRAADTKKALVEAWNILPKGTPERATIACMLIQQGCECFDQGTDSLTGLCDIIMFG